MKNYAIFYHPDVAARLTKLQPSTKKRVEDLFAVLKDNPVLKGLQPKKLSSTKSTYRIRVGNIKVIYEVQKQQRKVFIWEINFRGNIY